MTVSEWTTGPRVEKPVTKTENMPCPVLPVGSTEQNTGTISKVPESWISGINVDRRIYTKMQC